MNKFVLLLLFFTPFLCEAQQMLILKSGDTLHGEIVSTDEESAIIHFKKSNGKTVSIARSLLKHPDEVPVVEAKEKIKVKGWQEGYIIKREHGDTLWGLVKKNTAMGFVESVDFKPSDKEKKKPFRADSIIGFKYEHIVYNYFDCCGWSELIAHGKIDMYRGFIVKYKGMGLTTVENFIFNKKGNEKIIERDEAIKLLSGGILKNDVKAGFYYYFSDNPELMIELQNENFKYRDLINLVERYNEWAKNNPSKK
ncbi:MAG: hypothetical protein V4511_08555 [Bacteroidota bacterium]